MSRDIRKPFVHKSDYFGWVIDCHICLIDGRDYSQYNTQEEAFYRAEKHGMSALHKTNYYGFAGLA